MVDGAVLLYLKACVYLASLWRYGCLKFFQEGSSRNSGWSSVSPQYYTDLIYSSSLC